MSNIIISAEYFGGAILSARHHNNISALSMAHMLGVDVTTLHRYENGNDLIPRHVLRRVFTLAVMAQAVSENK